MIIWPLYNLYSKYRIKGAQKMFKKAADVKKSASISGIEGFLFQESVIAIAPILCAMAVRVILGRPNISSTSPNQLMILILVFSIWLIFNIKRSIDLRVAITKLDSWWANPKLVDTGLSTILWTKKKLMRLSQIEVKDVHDLEKIEFQKMITEKDEYGASNLDTSAVKYNLLAIGSRLKKVTLNVGIKAKNAAQNISAKGSDKIDHTLQSQVDSVINDSGSKIKNAVENILTTLGPLFVIYLLPYEFSEIISGMYWW